MIGKELRRRILAGIAAVAVAAGLLVASPIATPAADAAVGSAFSAGNIISDAVFYNSTAMTQPQVQAFIDSKVASCSPGYVCLENYRENTFTRAATSYCSTYQGVANQLASDIIVSVALACGINPQVLIVLLQKEQGLVTKSSPSSSAYQIATGFGCPDTAACDTQYYGFYNQVYSAARQYKIYQAQPSSFGYRAGRVNTILWNPNSACGTSQVYIENQATAGLYNYTPYRPNDAALSNMYGTGDGCSSYGNRNFWAYFSDWFGDPQGGGWLVKNATDPTVYLITSTAKYPVADIAMYNSLAALGPYRVVSDAYLAQFATGPAANNFLRDPTTGEIFFVGDGVKNRFDSCDLVKQYGATCTFESGFTPYIDVMPSALQRFAAGPPVTRFVHSTTTGQIYYVIDGEKRGVHSFAKIAELAAGGPATWASHTQTTLDEIPSGVDYVTPGMLVHKTTDSSLYLVNSASDVVPVTSAIAAEFGLGGPSTVADISIPSTVVRPAPLTVAVSCGSSFGIAGGGALWTVPSSAGLPVTSLDSATCDALPKAPSTVTGGVFLRVASTGWIYYISGGKKSFMSTMDTVNALNGAAPLVLIPTVQSVVDAIPTGPTPLAIARLVKSSAADTVYLIDGTTRKIPIDSFATAGEFGVAGYSVVQDSVLSGYTAASSALTVAVTCGSSSYIAGGGALWTVPSLVGLTPTTLDTATCSILPKASPAVTGAVFMRVASTGWIYYISGGHKTFMPTMGTVYALNGSAPLVLIPTIQSVVNAIPDGTAILGIAALVRTPSSPTVYLIDGLTGKIPIDSFATAAEFGVTGYSVVPNSSLATYTAAPAVLGPAVSCAAGTYIAGGGSLWAVPSSAGLPLTTLDPLTCAALSKSPQSVTGAVFLRVASTGWIYSISAGKKTFMTTMAAVYDLNGSAPLVLIPSSQSVVDSIPNAG